MAYAGCTGSVLCSSLVLHDVVLKNGCTDSNGGAIWVVGANVEIHDSTFQGNSVTFPPGSSSYIAEGGGAIHASGGADVKIYTSTFESNSAGYVSGWMMVSGPFLDFSLQFPAGHMQLLGWGHFCFCCQCGHP